MTLVTMKIDHHCKVQVIINGSYRSCHKQQTEYQFKQRSYSTKLEIQR